MNDHDQEDTLRSATRDDEPQAPDLLGPCPEWCKGRPHLDNSSAHACDQSHDSELLEFQVALASGGTELRAFAEIVWVPFSEVPGGSEVYVSMAWESDSLRLGPDDVLAVAHGLEGYAVQLRELSAQLATIRSQPLPIQGNPTHQDTIDPDRDTP